MRNKSSRRSKSKIVRVKVKDKQGENTKPLNTTSCGDLGIKEHTYPVIETYNVPELCISGMHI